MTTTPIAPPARSTYARSMLAGVDQPHIDRVAYETARRIVWADSALAVLDPGGGVDYEVGFIRTDVAGIVVDHRRPTTGQEGRPTGYDWFTVTINRGHANPARWDATTAPSDDDVITCWWTSRRAGDVDRHTAAVLCTFLQAVAVHYRAERAAQAEADRF